MNLSFEWRITNIIKKNNLGDLQNVILRVVYEYKGTDADSGETYTMLGGLDLDPPSSDNFTDIANLTQEQVIGWLDAHTLTPKLKEHIEAYIQTKIDKADEGVATEISWLEVNQNDTENPPTTEEPEA